MAAFWAPEYLLVAIVLSRAMCNSVAASACDACQGAHAVAIVTEWDEFKKLDYAQIFAGMHKPAFLFDGRNIVDLAALRALGFRAHGIGR